MISEVIMEPYLVEESTPVKLSSRLRKLVDKFDSEAKHHDFLVALMIVVMAEAGFSVTTSSSSSCDNDPPCNVVRK